MFKSILVVCEGNICRSPIGAKLLSNKLPGKKVTSAGVRARENSRADIVASEIASQHNILLDDHISRQLDAKLCYESDLILVMEQKHIGAVCDIAPEVRGKTMLYGHWNNKKDIADPYRKSKEMFALVYNLLDECAQKWADALSR